MESKYLIETKNEKGQLVRQHWRGLKQTPSEAERTIAWMSNTFSSTWIHTYRQVDQSEIQEAHRQGRL